MSRCGTSTRGFARSSWTTRTSNPYYIHMCSAYVYVHLCVYVHCCMCIVCALYVRVYEQVRDLYERHRAQQLDDADLEPLLYTYVYVHVCVYVHSCVYTHLCMCSVCALCVYVRL
jgi:hypothetical protein